MAVVIDTRLKEAEGEPNLAENFNRVLTLIDGIDQRVTALEEAGNAEEQPAEANND